MGQAQRQESRNEKQFGNLEDGAIKFNAAQPEALRLEDLVSDVFEFELSDMGALQ